MVKTDRDEVFLNPDEFGDPHTIDGKEVMAVVDEPQLEGSSIVFAKCEDLPTPRPTGDTLIVDGRLFTVQTWRVDCGMAEIALAQQISR